MSPDHEWIKRMIGHFNNIIRVNLGIQFQSSYHFSGQMFNSGIEAREEERHIKNKYVYEEKRRKYSVTVIDELTPAKLDMKDLNKTYDCKKKTKKLTKETNPLDDTGYETLQLEEDTFWKRINIIKQQLEREDHPLNQFISCFDQEFADFYMVLLSSDATKTRKLDMVIW